MSQAVIIKSSKNGINLVLDASMPFPELLTEILHKFTEAERFSRTHRLPSLLRAEN